MGRQGRWKGNVTRKEQGRRADNGTMEGEEVKRGDGRKEEGGGREGKQEGILAEGKRGKRSGKGRESRTEGRRKGVKDAPADDELRLRMQAKHMEFMLNEMSWSSRWGRADMCGTKIR